MNTVFMYIVWLPSQLKCHRSEPDHSERRIWVLEDCTRSEKLLTTFSGELMQLVCFLICLFICAIAHPLPRLAFSSSM